MEATTLRTKLGAQRKFLAEGGLRSADARKLFLRKLLEVIDRREADVFEALRADLGKCAEESFATETSFVTGEIRETLRELNGWMRPERFGTPLALLPAKSRVYREPLGIALVIAPWNYPFQLSLSPLVAAIAAGNAVVLKPSELAPKTAAIVDAIVKEAFPETVAICVQGGPEVSTMLLAEKYDTIFFTGGEKVGRIVYEAAAKHLTPVTLELGGKSPCIVEADADLAVTARRIAWGKFLNAGQTCVAPDYLLVKKGFAEKLIPAIANAVKEFFGDNPQKSPDYGRIVSDRHFTRLQGFLADGEVLFGGQHDGGTRYLAPTALRPRSESVPSMQEEIFGPVLPVIEYSTIEEAIAKVAARPKPLALYAFTGSSAVADRILRELSFGGGCVNDAILHLGNRKLPFGGVGASGIGAYHGRAGFELFSHRKSVLERPFLFDFPLRYPPYRGKLPWFRRALR